MELTMMFTKIMEKLGSVGVVVSALGCAGCFPALGALGATLGLGFLSRYEGLFINTLLPLFALLVLLLNAFSWTRHHVFWRGLLSVLPPIAILLVLYPLWAYGWSTKLFYAALVAMFAMSVFDLLKPAGSVQCQTQN